MGRYGVSSIDRRQRAGTHFAVRIGVRMSRCACQNGFRMWGVYITSHVRHFFKRLSWTHHDTPHAKNKNKNKIKGIGIYSIHNIYIYIYTWRGWHIAIHGKREVKERRESYFPTREFFDSMAPSFDPRHPCQRGCSGREAPLCSG